MENQAMAEGPSHTYIFHEGSDGVTSKVCLHVLYSLVCRDVQSTKGNSCKNDLYELWVMHVA